MRRAAFCGAHAIIANPATVGYNERCQVVDNPCGRRGVHTTFVATMSRVRYPLGIFELTKMVKRILDRRLGGHFVDEDVINLHAGDEHTVWNLHEGCIECIEAKAKE